MNDILAKLGTLTCFSGAKNPIENGLHSLKDVFIKGKSLQYLRY